MTKLVNGELFNSKNYKLRMPNGEYVYIYNLNKFCRENGLTPSNIHKVIKGQRNHHKGWTI